MPTTIDSLTYRFDHEQKAYNGRESSYIEVHKKSCYINPITFGLNYVLGDFAQNRLTHPTPIFLPLTTPVATDILTSNFTKSELIVTKNVLFLIKELLTLITGTISTAKTVELINSPKESSRQFIKKFIKRLRRYSTLRWDVDWTIGNNLDRITTDITKTYKETYNFHDMLEIYSTLVDIGLFSSKVLELLALTITKHSESILWDQQLSPSLYNEINRLYNIEREAPIRLPYYEINREQSRLTRLIRYFYNRTPENRTIREASSVFLQELNYCLSESSNQNQPEGPRPISNNATIRPRVMTMESTPISQEDWNSIVGSRSASFITEMDLHTPPEQEQGCCKIGLELEFWAKRGISPSYMRKYDIQNEYYSNQFELNNFISDFKNKKDIRTFFRKTKDYVNELRKELPSPLYFHTRAHQIDSRSLVFNGCHLHISLETVEKTRAFCKYLQYYKIIEKFKYDNFPSVRSIMSHHIWGSARDSEYNYKRKRKFRPVAFTSRNTVEIRLWDNEDILILKRADKIAALIIDTIKDFEQGKLQSKWSSNIPKITDTDDITTIYNVVQDNLTRNPNKHIVDSENTTIILPSTQTVEFILNDEESNPHINLIPRRL